jgi:hypothetical protein
MVRIRWKYDKYFSSSNFALSGSSWAKKLKRSEIVGKDEIMIGEWGLTE